MSMGKRTYFDGPAFVGVLATTLAPFRIVAMNTDGTVRTATAVDDEIIGTGCNEADMAIGERLDVANQAGLPPVVAGAAFNAGVWLTTDSTGRAVLSSTATDSRIGRAAEASTAAGDIVGYIPSIR